MSCYFNLNINQMFTYPYYMHRRVPVGVVFASAMFQQLERHSLQDASNRTHRVAELVHVGDVVVVEPHSGDVAVVVFDHVVAHADELVDSLRQ